MTAPTGIDLYHRNPQFIDPLGIVGTGDIAFNRDYAFNYSVNSTGTITATAGGAGSIIFELRKESTDVALA